MAKIDFTRKIPTFEEGEFIKKPRIDEDSKPEDADLAYICIQAVNSDFDEEEAKKASEEDKLKRFNLCCKIIACRKGCTLKAEEVAMIKKRCAKAYSPLIYGRVCEMIDPQEEEEEEEV